MSEYAHKLKVALLEQGQTQAWLADQLGVSTAAVSHWVKGRQEVPLERQEQIDVLLGTGTNQVQPGDVQHMIAQGTSPMAFCMRELPDVITQGARRKQYPVVGSEEHAAYSLERWAKYLRMDPGVLVDVMQYNDYLREPELARIFTTGIELTYLGWHLGEPVDEATTVSVWLAECDAATWADLERQLALVDRFAGAWESVERRKGQERAIALLGAVGPTAADAAWDMIEEMRA